MSLHADIKKQIPEAMRQKDAVRLGVLRSLAAAFTNELIAKRRKPEEELSDEEALAVVRRGVKQREDSIQQFRAGKREDLASAEEAELAILKTFLPPTVGKDEIRKVAEAKKAALGVADTSKAGILIGAVMKELKGAADGKDVKEVVGEVLS